MTEDNTVFILQKALKVHKAKVTKDSASEFLVSHPRYPSLKSVCDGLRKWNIDHYPLKLTKEEILDLEPPFIAHLEIGGGQLALVEKTDDINVTFTVNQGNGTIQSKKEFSKKLSGGVIVMEPDQRSGEASYRENRQNELVKAALLPFIVIALVLFGLYTLFSGTGLTIVQDRIPMLLLITKAVGIAASVFLVLHEFKVHTRIADKICRLISSSFFISFSGETVIFPNFFIIKGFKRFNNSSEPGQGSLIRVGSPKPFIIFASVPPFLRKGPGGKLFTAMRTGFLPFTFHC